MSFNKASTAINSVILDITKRIGSIPRGSSEEIYIREYHGRDGYILEGKTYCQVTKKGVIEFGFSSSGYKSSHSGGAIRHAPIRKAIHRPYTVKSYPHPQLTFLTAREIAEKVDKLVVGSVHGNIKNDLQWKEIYGVKERNLTIIDKNGTETTAPFVSCACHNCGLVLPMESIQVDHYMPQAGDEDLYTLKMLRALSLTVDSATGGKGRQVAAILNKSAAAIPTKGNKIGEYKFKNAMSLSSKWTTNNEGRSFLSLLGFDPEAMSSFKRICKNSILNLAPLCAQCNKNKSDRIKQIL